MLKGWAVGWWFRDSTICCHDHPSIGRVFPRNPACKGAAICNYIFVVAPLKEALALAAELKLNLKQDLDLDLDVPKFNCYVPGNCLDDDQAREFFKDTLANRQSFSDLAAMDAGVSTKGLRVAGVPIGDDAWVTKFVAQKVEAVIVDVGKTDHVLTDGIIHYHILRFCQNTRPVFLARNTLTPLILDSLGSLESFLSSCAPVQSFLSPCAPKALGALTQIGHPNCDLSITFNCNYHITEGFLESHLVLAAQFLLFTC